MEEMQDYMNEIRERLAYIKQFIDEVKTRKEKVEATAIMGNATLCRILGISEKTCYRYRQNEPPFNLPYHTNRNGTIYYKYEEVYKALSTDRIFGRGDARKEAALSRMRGFMEGFVTGKPSED